MRRFSPAPLAGLGLALLCGATIGANATERADFFDKSKAPTVKFDEKKLVWTLTNGALQRVVRFDPAAGSLKTVAFRDLKHLREIASATASEGYFSFAADMKFGPQALTNWKMTDAAPGSDWASPTYADAGWKTAALPLSGAAGKTVWLRAALPTGQMRFDHSYALIFDRAIDGDAEIYVDGALAENVANPSPAAPRFVQVDLLPKNKVVAVKFTGAKFGALPGAIGVAEVGSAPISFDLQSHWQYMVHSVNTGADNSLILTITLSGVKQYEGFDLDVSYQVYAGDEPMMAKWFTLVSHRPTRFLLDEAIYDSWRLPGAKPAAQVFSGPVFTATDPATRDGLMTAVLSPLGESERSADGKTITTILRPYSRVKTDERLMTPKSLTGVFSGPNATGAFLHQLYVGQYEARATATSVPTVFSTKSYGANITAAQCEKIIPEAAAIGAKIFLLDDGWQTNIPTNSGTYGDWVTDRRKFPLGLMPASTLVREQNMRFGLFAAPGEVSELSQVTLDHPEWLLKRPDGSRVAWSDATVGTCFTSGAAENFNKSLQIFCRELAVTDIKLGGQLFYDDCSEAAHDHPVAHALNDQISHWKSFCETMRTLSPDFTIDRQTDRRPELTEAHDTGTFGLWDAAMDGLEARSDHAEAPAYGQADKVRSALRDLQFTHPGFTLTAEAPCRLLTPDPAALDYALSSAAANAANLQIVGKIADMTAVERETTRKWVKWNEENRYWLAYTQPLPIANSPVDAILHLRTEKDGRYGWICLWNPTNQAARPTVGFNAADYFVKLGKAVDAIRLRDGQSIRLDTKDGGVTLPALAMAPHGWEIWELRSPTYIPVASGAKPHTVANYAPRGLSKRP